MRIELKEYNQQWMDDFCAAKSRLAEAMGAVSLEIEHIGSTSIPGLIAKPVIDIQIGVISIADLENSGGITALQSAGYDYLQNYESMAPFRRLFTRDSDTVRLENLHIVASDHPWRRRHLIFRDYLRANQHARDEYAAEKSRLAQLDWPDVNSYAGAKSEVVIKLEEEAFAFFDLNEEERAWIRTSRI